MSDAVATVTPGAGENVDVESLTVGANTVLRQRLEVAGAGAAEIARVLNAAPAGTEYGLVTRPIPSGTQAISAASLPLPVGAATEASLGTDGASPPAIPGTGVRGWLRSIYDTLKGTLVTDPVDRAARVLGHVTVDTLPAVSGTVAVSSVSGNVDVTPAAPAAGDYLPVRLTDGAAFYTAGAGGGGGGAVTVADGADVAQGTTTDAAWTSGAGTLVALLKAAVNAIKGTLTVAGTVTANVGTTAGLALDATLTGGTAKAVARGGAKGTTTAADVTSTASGANHQPLDAILYDASGNALLGQKAMAGSVPVAIASDQSAVPENVTQLGGSGTQLTGRPGFMPISIWFSNGSNVMNEVGFAAGQDKLPVQLSGLISTVPTTSTFALPVVLSPNGPIGIKPVTALGFYAVSGDTGTYGGLAANTPLFSFRWGDATRFGIILKVEVVVFTSVAASTAGITERQLIIARSFTASDTGGTALTPTLNNQKRRTSMGTSLATDIRIGNPLTAGTRTLDTNPVARALGWSALNHTGPIIGSQAAAATAAAWATAGAEPIKLLDAVNGQDHPIVLAQNEGIIVRLGVAQPTGSTQETWVSVVWAEAASY